jgi:hypothetical protein
MSFRGGARRELHLSGVAAVVGALFLSALVFAGATSAAQATHFVLSAPASVTVGHSFDVTVTAVGGNGKTDQSYSGTVTFSGAALQSSPAPSSTPAIFPASLTLTKGVGSTTGGAFTSYRAAAAATCQPAGCLTATDGTLSGGTGTTPSSLTILAGDPASVTTPQPPSFATAGSTFPQPVGEQVFDQYSNPVPNASVSMAIVNDASCTNTQTPPCTTFSGFGPLTTNASGSASFNLNITNPGVGYTVQATASRNNSVPVTSAVSGAFTVANQIKKCTGNSCSAQGSNLSGSGSSTVTAAGFTADSSLAVTVADSLLTNSTPPNTSGSPCAPPPGTPQNFSDITTGGRIDVVNGVAGQATFTVTLTINKSQVPINAGASHFFVCLGAINTNNPPPPHPVPGCSSPTTDQSFPTATGGCAQYDSGTNAFWGVLQDLPSSTHACTDSGVVFPGMLSKTKSPQGTVTLVFCVPSPFDPNYGW